jgi:hypothetical protein
LLWERQPRESGQAWQAFQLYLSLGIERSYEKVRQQLGKSRTIIERWGREWNWQERLRARDNWLFAEENKAQLNVSRRQAVNQGKLYDHAYKAHAEYILYLSSKAPANRTPREAEFLMRASDTLYRNHRDMFALTAAERARDDNENARIDLEYLRLKAEQSPDTTDESCSNLAEAMKEATLALNDDRKQRSWCDAENDTNDDKTED